jgi:integrase
MSGKASTGATRTRRRGRGEGGIRLRPDGRWEATVDLGYYGGRRRRKYLYGTTRREVAEKLTLVQADAQLGVPLITDRLTVSAWLDYWLETIVRAEREPTTYDGYEISVRRHIKPGLGDRVLHRLQPEHVEQWLRHMAARGTGARTCQFALQRLRTALNLALRRGYVARNVAELVEMPRQPQLRRTPPNLEDVRRVLEVTQGDRLRGLIIVALGLGLRRGEILGLRWEQVDLERRTLTVSARVNRVRGTGLIVRQGAKSAAGERTIALPQIVADALHMHRLQQRRDRLLAGARWKGADDDDVGPPTGFVFTSTVGTVMEPRRVDTYYADVRARSGLSASSFHGLRHDFAGLLLTLGVAPRVVQEMMGHSNYHITMNRYTHVPDALQRDAASRIDVALGSATGDGGRNIGGQLPPAPAASSPMRPAPATRSAGAGNETGELGGQFGGQTALGGVS